MEDQEVGRGQRFRPRGKDHYCLQEKSICGRRDTKLKKGLRNEKNSTARDEKHHREETNNFM